MDKCTKGKVLVRGPDEGYIFFGQDKQRSCDVGVILDETMVKVAKAKERLKVFEFL